MSNTNHPTLICQLCWTHIHMHVRVVTFRQDVSSRRFTVMDSAHNHWDIPNDASGWMMVRGMAKGDVIVVHPPDTAGTTGPPHTSHVRHTLGGVGAASTNTPNESSHVGTATQRVSATAPRVSAAGALYEDEYLDMADDDAPDLFSSTENASGAPPTTGVPTGRARARDTDSRPLSTQSHKHHTRKSHFHAPTESTQGSAAKASDEEIPDGFCAPCCQGYVYCTWHSQLVLALYTSGSYIET